jgi:hypothetical protein
MVTRISGTLDCCSLAARCPAHHRPASARAVLVEDLLGGQQRPKALQPLLDAHIYLRLNRGFKHRALYARRPAHYAPARGGAILVNNLFGTEQGPQALQALPNGHTHLHLINIHTVCMLPPSLRMSRLCQRLPFHSAR